MSARAATSAGASTSTSGKSVWMRSWEAGERPLTPTTG